MTKKSDKQASSPQEKDILSKIEQEFKRHTGILMEEMKSTVKTVTEQHGTVVERLDNIESELDTLKAATMENSMQTKALKSGQERIEKKLDTITDDHEHRIQKLEAVR